MRTLAEMMDNLPGNVYWKDKQGKYLDCNKNTLKTFRLTSKQKILGRTDHEFLPKALADLVRKNDRTIMKEKKSRLVEERGERKNKTIHYLSYKAPFYDEKRKIIGIVGISFDITEVKMGEEEKRKILEEIIDIVPANVYWKDRNSRYLGCNKHTLDFFKIQSQDLLPGKTDSEMLQNPFGDYLRQKDINIMETNNPYLVEEIDPSHSHRCYLSYKAPLHDSNSKVVGIAGISFDITERKQMEENLTRAEITEKAQAERIRILQSIGFSIAHELRTPLTAIYGSCAIKNYFESLYEGYKLAEKAGLPVEFIPPHLLEKIKPAFLDIQKVAIQASHFIDMLITYIRSQTQTTNYYPEVNQHFYKPYSMLKCVNAILATYPFQATDNPHSVHLDQTVDFQFSGDHLLVEHILFNLLRNALYYLRVARKGRITLRCEKGEEHNLVYFKDTGTGISKNVLPHIFEHFYSTRDNCSGIGLAYCRWAMQQLKGEITCHSVLGKYTEFILSFPKLVAGPKRSI